MDEKLIRYFAALKDETEAAQRGTAADVNEIISDISRLCEDVYTEEEMSFALASVFDPSMGIFDVVEKLLPNRDRSIQKGKESCLAFVADFIRRTGIRAAPYILYIKERCISIFQRDDSKSVQAAALLPLISLLELCMQEHAPSNFYLDWTAASVFLQEYRKAKSSGTLRSNILVVLGSMVECSPSMFKEENTIIILNVCLDSLDEQLRQKGKDPLFVLVAGAMKSLDGILTWFDRTLPAGGSVDASRRIYVYLEQVLYFREDLKRYEMVKAALRLLSRHACFFRLRLLDDSMAFLKWLESYCTHVNAQLRDAALPAFNEFMLQISIGLSTDDQRITNAHHVYKKLLVHALDILDAKDQNSKLIALAIRMVGKLSPAIMKFSGKNVLQQAFQRVAAFGSFSQRLSEVQEESLGFSVTLVGAVADIIDTLEYVDNYVITIITEAVGIIFFNFPNLFPKQKPPVFLTIQELFITLQKQGSIFSVFVNNIVWSSLERAMEPAKQDGELKVELWRSYTELWSNLIDFDSAKYFTKEKKQQSSEIPFNDGAGLQIQEKLFDAMILCVMKALRELNLKYRVKGATTDKESSEAEGAMNPDSDINPIEPLNDQDMKRFLNLVEFVQGFFSSKSVPFYAKWVLPFMRCLVELSSCYPLLSGFYKLLTITMRIADDNGYFKQCEELQLAGHDISSVNQVGTENRQVQPYAHQEAAVCRDLLRRYLQEVLISSKRYKLELLASCLRLCLSAPPLLMGLRSIVDPIKVALQMGLRYIPLADVAMDALERWTTFNKKELHLWLHTIVPYFNPYLSINMAASISEIETSHIGNIENRNAAVRRIQRERKEKMQQDPYQRLQLRIQKFLGRIGEHAHSLVPDVNLLQIVGAGGLAWDTTEQLRFILPFRDDKTDAWLDSLLPRIVDLALSAGDRSTKVVSSELLHAMCLLMMGNAAKGPSRLQTGERPSVHYEKIYRKVFPAVVRLAADVEQVTRELFSKLVMQAIHWFTSNVQRENPDSMALLDSILDGLVDRGNASLREFCADCYEEFLRWSIRHAPPEVDNFMNVTSMLRRLYNRLDHPNPYHRLGSAMACSRLYRVMRENKSIVDRHLLEMFFFCIKSLRIAENDPEQIGTMKQVCKVLDDLQRLLKRNISTLTIKRKDRAMFITLDDFLEWLFKQTTRPQVKCRSRCMYLLSSICEVLKENSSFNWLEAYEQSKGFDRAFIVINTNSSFSMQIYGRAEIENMEHEMRSLTRSMHWCDWALRTELVALKDLSSKASNLFLSIKEFLNCMLKIQNSKVDKFLTPLEFERYEKIRCRVSMHFLSFTTEIICSGFGIREDYAQSFGQHTMIHPEMGELISRLVPVKDYEFIELLFLLLLTPQEFGFKGNHTHSYETLSRLILKIIKLLILCSILTKDNVMDCLRSFLANRLDLDLCNVSIPGEASATSGSFELESFKYLLRGYQHLLLAGILLPVLGKEKAYLTAERLLRFVFSLSTRCSSTLEALSSEVLSLTVSLGIKIERLLDLVFDETPMSGSSTGDAAKSAGSVFYMRFRKVLIQKVKFFYKEGLSLLLCKASENFTARLLVNALLDDYLSSRTEENVITAKSFLNEFVSQMSYLAPCCRSDAPYSDRVFFLEVLHKLLLLDADGETVLSPTQPSFQFIVDTFFFLLGGACTAENTLPGNVANKSMNVVVQNSALSLVPHFVLAASSHLFLHQISAVLMNIVTNVLLVREADLPAGSTHRATYLQTLDRLLAAVCSSKSPQLLEVLFPILQNCMPLARKRLSIALKAFANRVGDHRSSVCSTSLQALHDGAKVPSLKRAVIDLVLIPILEVAPVDFLLAWYAEHIKGFLHAISRKPNLEEQQIMDREEDLLVVKSCNYKIISCLFMNATASAVRDTITPLVSNQQLMQVATNDSRAKNDPSIYLFPENVSLWQELHIQAYNCLAAIVMCTQEQERIFTILFKDFAGKPLWQHLIDSKQLYSSFPVEISQLGSLQDVTRNLRSNRLSTRIVNGETPLLSQYVIGATLSQEPSLIDSFVGGISQNKKVLEDFETKQDAADAENIMVQMDLTDQDDFDKHPSFHMVLRLISHLHSKFKVPDSQEMPEWMKALHSTLCNSGTPINTCLFIIKVVIKARKVFEPFGSEWIVPILQPFLKHPENCGGNKFHYILRDVCVIILEWNLPNPPHGDVASRFLNHLFKVAPHESNQVMRANLEIIHHFLARWKDAVILDTSVVASHLTAGGKSPSAMDKSVTMHKIVGLQLFGAMMSVGLNPCDDAQIPEKDWIKALLSNLNFKVKGVYEASAELLGMLLQKQKDIHHEQTLESGLKQVLLGLFKEGETVQFLTIIDKITFHCPSFFEGYSSMIFDLLPRVHGVFRILSLSIILRCPSAVPNLFSLALPFLSKMLAHRDEIAQLKSLQLVAELVKDADKQLISEQVLPLLSETFSTHDSVECRRHYYEVLIFLHTTRKMTEDQVLTCSLLRGLCDDSDSIRESLQNFWHKQMSGDPRRRFLETVTKIYDPVIEDHWVHIANSLLLKLCEEAVDFKRPIFNAPLSDCEFKEYTIDTAILSGTLPMTPMFLDTEGTSSQIQTQDQDGDHSLHPIRHPNMIRATMSQSQTLDSSDGRSSFSTFTSGEGESSLFALSQRQNRRNLDSTMSPGTHAPGNVSVALKRRLLHPSASRPQILRSVLNTMKRREARLAQQAVERANKVHILRRYRIGDLPDIEINHEEIIKPLAALSERDPIVSRLLLQVLCRAIYAIAADQHLDGENDLKTLATRAIENAFERTQSNISFVSTALSLCLEDKNSWIQPSLIGSVSLKSANFQSGILYLENALLNSSVPWQYAGNARKRHRGSRGQVTMEPHTLEQAWLELANLYRSIGENDVVLSIYKRHLTKASVTHCALEAELGGESVRALRLYDKAIDSFNDMEGESVVPSDIEQDLWYTRRLYCLASLLNWRAVMDEILFQIEESLERLWEPRVQDSYLNLFIKAAIKIPTHHAKLTEFLQPLSDDSWKKSLILKEFSNQVATLAVSNDQFDRARFLIHECYRSFLKHWAEFHPLATSARRLQIINLQKTTELSEFLDNIANHELIGLPRLLTEWKDRWPSSDLDNAEAWDDIVQTRLLFYQKMQSAFNSKLDKGKEEEGVNFSCQLDDERAHLYYAASKGLMKQGNFEAAKNYMNQFVALRKDKLDFASFKNIIKLRSLEADRMSRTDLQKASDMLQQVISYIGSTSQKHEQQNWQIGLKLLEGSAYSQLGWLNLRMLPRSSVSPQAIHVCLTQLGLGLVAYRDGLLGLDKGRSDVSSRTLAKSALKFAFFCDELLKSAESAKWGPQIQEAMQKGSQLENLPAACTYPNLIVKHVMKAVQLDHSIKAHHGIARVLTLVGQYRSTSREFVSGVKDVSRWLFIPWIPQMLSSLDKDDGENFVDILEDIAKMYPQAIYYSYNVSKLDFGPMGCSRAACLESILRSPIFETLVRSLEDLTFPEQRLRDGLAYIKSLLEGGNREKAKSYFRILFYDCLDAESMTKENRGSGEYNLKFAREYSKRVVDAVGQQGAKLLSMNEKQFSQATGAIMANLQKAMKNLPSGNLSLSSFSKWMADFDFTKDMWFSHEVSETSNLLMSTIDMFGSYNGFQQPDPSSHVKVVSFDQSVFSLSSKQRPKVLKVRGSDELEYKFIVKGGEDLRLDQRIEQLFEMMNAILSRDPSCSKRKLSVRTYAVIPVSRQCGLLQFVENTRSLDEIVKDGLASILPGMGVTGKTAPGEVTSNIRMKFHEWLDKRGGSQNVVDCYRNMYAKVRFPEMSEKMSSFVSGLPWDTLRNALFKLTTSAESFLALRAQYQRSLAVLSICGYVAGVGDRHLGNLLVDIKGGALIPIDFGYSFGTGVILLPVPELIPFRLTPQLTNVLLPQDGVGLLRNDMVLVMNALHNSKEIVSAVMDVFVKEPLVDWKTEAMKTASWRNNGPPQVGKTAALEGQTADYEQHHVALKVEFAQRKLDLWNPAQITLAELQSSIHAGKPYMIHLEQIVRGDPDRNVRARIPGTVCKSTQEQVDCLIDQAMDVNLLGRVWLGWQPWI